MSDPHWTVRRELGAITGAFLPPIGGGVDHWVASNVGTVGFGEISDPVNHRSNAQTIAGVGTIWVICPINDGCSVGGSRTLEICDPYIRCRVRLEA